MLESSSKYIRVVSMRLLISPILLAVFTLLLLACEENEDVNTPITPPPCTFNVDTMDFSFGINYDVPDQYLIPGEESDLKDSYFEEIKNAIGIPNDSIEDILRVCHWVNQNFTFSNAGGAMAGVNTVDELYEIKTFYGCHSLALIISSILREFGFPAVMIETADVQWAYDYNAGKTQNFAGHIMSEIYVNGKWILLDNNCSYVEEYDYLNPYISQLHNPENGYFVFAKGVDIWDYSGRVESFTHEKMVEFSNNVHCYEELFYTVTYSWGS